MATGLIEYERNLSDLFQRIVTFLNRSGGGVATQANSNTGLEYRGYYTMIPESEANYPCYVLEAKTLEPEAIGEQSGFKVYNFNILVYHNDITQAGILLFYNIVDAIFIDLNRRWNESNPVPFPLFVIDVDYSGAMTNIQNGIAPYSVTFRLMNK